jgi:hypothetical protein|tara:strand:- start:297 stop:632 length:336 start_codon:yes stop_codon:yes gene_type:complete
MAVFVSNITIEQGFDFDTSFQLEDTRTNSPLVLTGVETEGMLRKSYSSSSSVSFASTVADDSNGIISISLTSTQTAALKPGRYVYDIKITNAGKEYKAVEGSALVRAGVTR